MNCSVLWPSEVRQQSSPGSLTDTIQGGGRRKWEVKCLRLVQIRLGWGNSLLAQLHIPCIQFRSRDFWFSTTHLFPMGRPGCHNCNSSSHGKNHYCYDFGSFRSSEHGGWEGRREEKRGSPGDFPEPVLSTRGICISQAIRLLCSFPWGISILKAAKK